MTHEELEQAVHFLAQRQDYFTEALDRLAARQDRLEERLEEMNGHLAKLADAALVHSGHLERVLGLVENLGEAQRKLTASQQSADHQQEETRERLDHLVAYVERYISEQQAERSRRWLASGR